MCIRDSYWSAGSGKLLHYFIDAESWDEYYPPKETEDPFPRTFYPKKRPVTLPRGGSWQYIETDWAALDVTDEEFGGDYLVSQWIGQQLSKKHDKPFFLACGIYRPHEPWFVPKEYFEPFPLEGIQLPPGYREDDLDDLPPAGKERGPNRYFHTFDNKDNGNRASKVTSHQSTSPTPCLAAFWMHLKKARTKTTRLWCYGAIMDGIWAKNSTGKNTRAGVSVLECR